MLKIGLNNNSIEFKVEVENTTFDKVKPRLVIEVNNDITIIPLKINKEGIVKGDINLKENWSNKEGNIKLEIINENNYFVPFEKKVFFNHVPPTPRPIIKEVKNLFTIDNSLDFNNEINNFFKGK
jgi:hypothetical protein